MNTDIENELERVRSANVDDLLIPEEIVKFAENSKTALHSQFEWDQTRAAQAYRLSQARLTLESV